MPLIPDTSFPVGKFNFLCKLHTEKIDTVKFLAIFNGLNGPELD